jgi:malate synthase
VWQWTHAGTRLADTGKLVTAERVRSLLDELGFDGTARDLFEQVALADDFATFLTLPAYELID